MLKLLWAVPDCLCWPKDLIRLTVRYNRGAEPWHIKSLDYLFTHKLCCFVNTLLMRSGKFLLHVSYRFFKRDHDTCCHTLEMSCSTPSSLDWCKLEIRCLVSNTNCALLKLSKKHSWTHPRLTEHDYCSKWEILPTWKPFQPRLIVQIYFSVHHSISSTPWSSVSCRTTFEHWYYPLPRTVAHVGMMGSKLETACRIVFLSSPMLSVIEWTLILCLIIKVRFYPYG